MHFSAPSHPLVYSFLLRREAFNSAGRIIVETREQGEKLLQTLEALEHIHPTQKIYRLISTPLDILEVYDDPDMVGIFPIETLDWKIDEKEQWQYCFDIEKGMKCGEEKLISWLTEHGYIARKSDEIGTYFRAGDTVSVPLKKGILRVSFFGTTVEDIFLDDTSLTSARVYALNPLLPAGRIS